MFSQRKVTPMKIYISNNLSWKSLFITAIYEYSSKKKQRINMNLLIHYLLQLCVRGGNTCRIRPPRTYRRYECKLYQSWYQWVTVQLFLHYTLTPILTLSFSIPLMVILDHNDCLPVILFGSLFRPFAWCFIARIL